jgi:hypothetical protein
MAGRSRRLRIEEVQQRWCFSLAASGFWGWRLPFSGGTQALWLLGESSAVNGSMGEIVAPAITGINRPRRRRWKCLCQCRARPEIIIMGEPQVQVTIVGTIIYLLCACFSVHCALCTQHLVVARPRGPHSCTLLLARPAQVVRICAPPPPL